MQPADVLLLPQWHSLQPVPPLPTPEDCVQNGPVVEHRCCTCASQPAGAELVLWGRAGHTEWKVLVIRGVQRSGQNACGILLQLKLTRAPETGLCLVVFLERKKGI